MELINFRELEKYAILSKEDPYKPRNAQDNDLLQDAKFKMYRAALLYKNARKSFLEVPTEINSEYKEKCRARFINAYSGLAKNRLEAIYQKGSETIERRLESTEWLGSECVVSHMIYADNNRTKFDKPVYYVVRGFEEQYGQDLAGEYYKNTFQGTVTRKFKMIVILRKLSNFWREQSKYLFQSKADKDQEKKMQWEQHIETLIQSIDNSQLQGRLGSTVDYSKFYEQTWEFNVHGGKMTVQTIEATPVLSNLQQNNYPQKVEDMINAMFSDTKLASRVLLVNIELIIGDSVAQHFLTLSEYDRDEMPLSMVRGLETNWFNADEEGWDDQITHSVLVTKTVEHKLRCPMPEFVMIEDMWQLLLTSIEQKKGTWLSEENNETKVLEEQGKKLVDTLSEEWEREPEDLDFSGLPARNFFFSADDICAQLTFFNLEFEENRRLLQVEQTTGNYVVGVFTRYPFVYYNLEHRYKLAKKAWKEEMKTENNRQRPTDYQRPTDFQRPTLIQRYDNKKVLDKHDRETFPLQQIVQNDHMSYLEMLKRKLKREHTRFTDNLNIPRDLPYYVNDLEDDENIVYVKTFHTQQAWDQMNLFRIEAETDVSRYMFDQGKMIFYEFRRTAENLERHPFRQYLKLFPDAKKKWQEVWREKQNLTHFVAMKIENGRYVRRDNPPQPSGRRQWKKQPAPEERNDPNYPPLPAPAPPRPARENPQKRHHNAQPNNGRHGNNHWRGGHSGLSHDEYMKKLHEEKEKRRREDLEKRRQKGEHVVEERPLKKPEEMTHEEWLRELQLQRIREDEKKRQEAMERKKAREEREKKAKEQEAEMEHETELERLARLHREHEENVRKAREDISKDENLPLSERKKHERELLKEAERKAREEAKKLKAEKKTEEYQRDEHIVRSWVIEHARTQSERPEKNTENSFIRTMVELKTVLRISIYTALNRLGAADVLSLEGFLEVLSYARQLLKETRQEQRFRERQRAGAERLKEQQKKALANARRREPKGKRRYGSDFDGRRENEQFLLRRLCGMCAAEAEPEV